MKKPTKAELNKEVEELRDELNQKMRPLVSETVSLLFVLVVLVGVIGLLIVVSVKMPSEMLPTRDRCSEYEHSKAVLICKNKGGIPVVDYADRLENCIFN